jgi:hypothetical protein
MTLCCIASRYGPCPPFSLAWLTCWVWKDNADMISLSLSLYFSSLRKRTYESESTTATTCIVGIVVLIPSVSLCINRVNCRVEDHIVQRSFRVQARGRPQFNAISPSFRCHPVRSLPPSPPSIALHGLLYSSTVRYPRRRRMHPGTLQPTTSSHCASAPASPLTTSPSLRVLHPPYLGTPKFRFTQLRPLRVHTAGCAEYLLCSRR